MLGEYVIAKYIRLSLDDAQTDSMSIENQGMLLDRYIAGIDAANVSVLEFVDNGYSGTNFERPGVQELLELVRGGRVNCIVVKDFSRFGRNAIETGYFIERVFPFYRIRFISVDDCFDSAGHEGDTGGLEVSFKFLMHEYYSRDLSKKITSARREKIRRGESVSKNCVYGYVLDDKRNMVIDPAAADTVRLIFNMYGQGKSVADIEKRLYEEDRLCPAAYKKWKRVTAQDERFACVWQKSVILSILRDEQYTGMYVAGKTRALDPVSHSRVQNAEEDWVKIPGHHPAIIPQALFDTVREKLRARGEPLRRRKHKTSKRYAGNDESPLKGKVFCGHCGHSLRISCTKNAAFHCWFTRSAGGAPCHKLRIPKSGLEDTLFAMISRQVEVILNCDGIGNVSAREPGFSQDNDFLSRIEECRDEKRALYERFILGAVSEEDYKAKKAMLEEELARLEQAYTAFLARKKIQGAAADVQKIVKTSMLTDGLTREIVDLLVDKVLVYPGGRLEVFWKIADFTNTSGDEEDLKYV